MTEQFKSWEEMTTLEQMQCQYWDMYKDAFGVRPRGIDTSGWTEAYFEQEFALLADTIQQNEEAAKESERAYIAKFEARVNDLVSMGAKNRETALCWIMDGSDAGGDFEYLAYLEGLPYNYFSQ
jgi:hypothetical protein